VEGYPLSVVRACLFSLSAPTLYILVAKYSIQVLLFVLQSHSSWSSLSPALSVRSSVTNIEVKQWAVLAWIRESRLKMFCAIYSWFYTACPSKFW